MPLLKNKLPRNQNPSANMSRYERSDAREMLGQMPLGELMSLAYQARKNKHPQQLVTFVIDTNPNYTNICVTCCDFCAFFRRAGHDEAYTLSPDELAERVRTSYARGASTVLLQGGHNPEVGLQEWLAYIRAIQSACPEIHIHPFSPAEYIFISRLEKLPVENVLRAIYDEGIRTIPGGGAEILAKRPIISVSVQQPP